MKNVLTIDFEDWYHPLFVQQKLIKNSPSTSIINEATKIILNLLSKYRIRATFFVLGQVAEAHPEICRELILNGHEIATHGYNHKVLFGMTEEEFKIDLRKSIEIITSITGRKPTGYRAPVASVNSSNFWVFDVIKDEGLKYDSSIYPIDNGLVYSGIRNCSKKKHLIIEDLWEIPLSTVKVGFVELPLSGGFYLRTLPISLYIECLKRINNKGQPLVMYVHPWEICTDYPKIISNPLKRFIQYYNLKSVVPKLEILFRKFQFTSIEDVFFVLNNN